MFARIERGLYTTIGVLAAVALLAWPAAAEAQTDSESVVVEPGDSLWSISAERLGPGTSARQIAKGAERVHALNRNEIGADPDLIVVGQELVLPPGLGPDEAEPTAEAVSGREAPKPATEAGKAELPAPETRGVATEGSKPEGPRPGLDENGGGNEARGQAARTPRAPKVAAGNPAPAVAGVPAPADEPPAVAGFLGSMRLALASVVAAASSPGDTYAGAYAAQSRQVSILILLLTIIIGILGAWKLPIKRAVGGHEYWVPYAYPPSQNTFAYARGRPDDRARQVAETVQNAGDGDVEDPKRLLLIEDHAIVRDCLELVLCKRTGVEVLSSGSLSEAHQTLKDSRSAVNLIIVDDRLIANSQARQVEWLLEADVPVLTLSGSRKALRPGQDSEMVGEMLTLDYELEELLCAVETRTQVSG